MRVHLGRSAIVTDREGGETIGHGHAKSEADGIMLACLGGKPIVFHQRPPSLDMDLYTVRVQLVLPPSSATVTVSTLHPLGSARHTQARTCGR